MDELSRERAYARMIVAIVGDPDLAGEARTYAIDTLTMALTVAADGPNRQDGQCIHPGVFAHHAECWGMAYCPTCRANVPVEEL